MSRVHAPRARLLAILALALTSLSISACKEVETETAEGYEPATLKEINEDLKQVTLTEEGAARTGVKTAQVSRRGPNKVVPYAALIYDPDGNAYVYTSPKPLTYLRKEVDVGRVNGNQAVLSKGPATGTKVVTVGAAEVYGTELEVAASH